MEKTYKNEKYILVVEDRDDIFLYLETVISKKKIKILHAETGLKAIQIFNDNKDNITLVLMDIGLPDMTGYEIAPELLKIKKIPIVVQSAYSYNSEKEKAFNAGCIDYITKPVSTETLNRIIDKYFFS